MAFDITTVNKVLDYMRSNSKSDTGETYDQIGEKLNLSGKQVHYIYNRYKNTPTSENYQDFEVQSSDIPAGYEKVPSGTIFKDGTIGYELVKKEVTFEEQLRSALKDIDVPIIKDVVQKTDTMYLLWSDQHVGMSSEGNPFNKAWFVDAFNERIEAMIKHVDNDCNVVILMLGDLIDGELGYTASRTHKLTQNLHDGEMFSVATRGLMRLIKGCQEKAKGWVRVCGITNCNHNTYSDWKVLEAVQIMTEDDETIEVEKYDEFLNHAETPDVHLILTHGKDRKFRSRGLKLELAPNDHRLILNFIEANGLTNKPVVLVRGDLHRAFMFQHPEFTDIMVPSFAPGSGWVASNFGSNDAGGFGVMDIVEGYPIVYFPKF